MTDYHISLQALTLEEDDFEVLPSQQPPPPAPNTDVFTSTDSPFVNALLSKASNNLARTENNAVTHASTLSPQLDFFFEIVKDTSSDRVIYLLRTSWQEHPLDTLKLVWHLRDVRNGKAQKPEFYKCMQWLYNHHHNTFMLNLKHVAQVGYWKDLPELVTRLCVGTDVYEEQMQREKEETVKLTKVQRKERAKQHNVRKKALLAEIAQKDAAEKDAFREERIRAALEKDAVHQQHARDERHAKRDERLQQARHKFAHNKSYRSVHLAVANLFAHQLRKDKAMLAEGKTNKLTLAAKWAPSPGCKHDALTLMATAIAQLLVPKEKDEVMVEYVNRARHLYQRDYLAPLRKAQAIPEPLMSSSQWDKIDYARVASVCMNKTKKTFKAHDEERFAAYLESVKKGESKIQSQALMPHELVRQIMNNTVKEGTEMDVVELQWKDYVTKLQKVGDALASAISIVDVSGSMSGEPMEAALALGMLVSELAKPPFNQVVITFSATPGIYRIEGNTLSKRVKNLTNMDWGYNTDFQKVFDLILETAKEAKITDDDMVKTLFVFSDMEFDEAQTVNGSKSFDTDHQIIKKKYAEAGYTMPQIVYWNLRGTRASTASKPVTVNEKGVAMVSGFSGQLLKLFLEGKVKSYTPWKVMREAIDTNYDYLVVVD